MFFPILITSLGAFIGFANPIFHLPVLALLLPGGAAWIGTHAASAKKAFYFGWLAGALAYAASLYWVALPVHNYGFLPWVLALPCPVLLGAYLGLYPAFFALGLYFCRELHWSLVGLGAGCLWGLLEALRGMLFTGFPWLVLASAFSIRPFVLQGVSLIGAYGLSGVLTAIAVWLGMEKKISRQRICALGLIALIAGYGLVRVSAPVPEIGNMDVSIIQGNIDQSLKWDPAYQEETVRRYLTLSDQEAESNAPDLIVWPETALPFYFQDLSPLGSQVLALAKEREVYILAGSPAYSHDMPADKYYLHNRAYLIGPKGIIDYYDKEHLVPFGEYIPFGEYLPFLSKLVQGVGDFMPGVKAGPITAGRLAPGVLICYETIYPELAQARVENGANVLVNISNDAWFGRSSAPRQHLHLSVLRAVEQGRYLVRATNTGISAVIDPRGGILSTTDLFKTQTLHVKKVGLVQEKTWYHRNRKLVLSTLFGGAAIFLFLGFFRRTRR
ncbi:MAG: apolipoprotein N-acyltransferase [Thermodesulfobacteriota bacterium]|nr:apolipoprotein N-acyltransferase [Thermodesulfobacteriota bacterium]